MPRLTDQILNAVNLIGTALTTTYQGGAWIALAGTEELEAAVNAAFDAATTITSISFRLVVSPDTVIVDPLPTTDSMTTAAAAVDHVFAASAGNSVRGRLQVAQSSLSTYRMAKYVRIEAKNVGSTTKAGDIATCTLTYGHL